MLAIVPARHASRRPRTALAIILTFKQFGPPGKSKCRAGPLLSLGFKQLARTLHASLS
jgi:hypothetical protein